MNGWDFSFCIFLSTILPEKNFANFFYNDIFLEGHGDFLRVNYGKYCEDPNTKNIRNIASVRKKGGGLYPGIYRSAGGLLIEAVARDCQVSQPTVIRFVKAAGYEGFRDFKYAFVKKKGGGSRKMEIRSICTDSAVSKDRLEDIPGKIVTTSMEMLEETLQSVQIREYKKLWRPFARQIILLFMGWKIPSAQPTIF